MVRSQHQLALWLAAAFAVVWLGAIGTTLLVGRLPASADGPVLAVFPPGVDGAAASARIFAADGIPLGPVGVAFVWTATSRDAGFVGRLQEHGALLVVRPVSALYVSGLCGAGMERVSPRSVRSPR